MKERLGPLSGSAKPETQLWRYFRGAIGYKGKTSPTVGRCAACDPPWEDLPGDLVLENYQSASLGASSLPFLRRNSSKNFYREYEESKGGRLHETVSAGQGAKAQGVRGESH